MPAPDARDPQPPHPPARVRWLWFAAAAALLAVIAYAALPALLVGVAERLLIAQGFRDAHVEFTHPGLRGLRLPTVAFAGTLGAQAFELRARDVQVDYTVRGLLRGRVMRVRIADAALRLTATADAATAQPLALAPPGNWVARVPLEEFALEALHMEWRRAQARPLTATVRATLRRTDAALQVQLSLADAQQEHLALAADLTAAGELHATLSAPGAAGPAPLRVSAALRAHDERTLSTRVSLDAQLGALRALAAPWLDLPAALARLDGRVQAHWDGTLPAVWPAAPAELLRNRTLAGALTLDLTGIALPAWFEGGALHAEATLAGGERGLHWRIADNLRAAARIRPALLAFGRGVDGAKAGHATRLRAPRGLGGELALAPAGLTCALAPAELLLEQLHTPDVSVAEVRAALAERTRITYDGARGALRSDGVALRVAVPAIEPHFAAIGTITDMTLRARLAAGSFTAPVVDVEEAALRLLGGRLRTSGVRYEVTRERNDFALEIEQLDLARVVALESQLGVEASGTLDGRLPVALTRSGITVTDGTLRARAPGGIVRYRPNEAARAMAESNPSVQLVQQALSNYHYDRLEASASYAENGDLTLQVAMAGRNPDWNAGQPINLNLQVSDNIPTLLRSLRLADDISAALERRVLERSTGKP